MPHFSRAAWSLSDDTAFRRLFFFPFAAYKGPPFLLYAFPLAPASRAWLLQYFLVPSFFFLVPYPCSVFLKGRSQGAFYIVPFFFFPPLTICHSLRQTPSSLVKCTSFTFHCSQSEPCFRLSGYHLRRRPPKINKGFLNLPHFASPFSHFLFLFFGSALTDRPAL